MKLISALLVLFSILSQLNGFYLFDSASLGDAYIFVDAIDSVPQYAENLVIKSFIVEDEYDNAIQPNQIVNGAQQQQQQQNLPKNVAQLEEQLQKEEKLIVDAYFAKLAQQQVDQLAKQKEIENTPIVDKKDAVPVDNPFLKLDKLDNSTIYFIFDQIESQEKVQDLINYIADITYVPLQSIQLIKNWRNMALIRVTDDQVDMSDLIDTILKYTYDIELKKNMKINECGLAIKSDLFRVAKSSTFSGENVLIIVIIVFVPIMLAIILAMALCILKKRRQLREDEEVLVKDDDESKQQEKSKKRFHPYNWVIPILKKSRIGLKRDVSPSQEYKDLCRQRMESPINSTLSTTMSNINTPGKVINSSTINSTPIRITNDAKNMNDNDRNSS